MAKAITLYQYRGTAVKVVDGDTMRIQFDLGFGVSASIIVRLAGINAPELNSQDESVRALANQSKLFLANLVAGKTLYIHSHSLDLSKDIYGRSIAEIFLDQAAAKSVNQMMVDGGYAVYQKY